MTPPKSPKDIANAIHSSRIRQPQSPAAGAARPAPKGAVRRDDGVSAFVDQVLQAVIAGKFSTEEMAFAFHNFGVPAHWGTEDYVGMLESTRFRNEGHDIGLVDIKFRLLRQLESNGSALKAKYPRPWIVPDAHKPLPTTPATARRVALQLSSMVMWAGDSVARRGWLYHEIPRHLPITTKLAEVVPPAAVNEKSAA